MREFNATDKAFFSLLSNALFGTELNIDENSDFKEVFKEAKFQAVDTLIFDAVAPYLDKSASLYGVWYKKTLRTYSRNYNIESAHNLIGKILEQNNIEYSTLKGCRSSYYYSCSYKRVLGDVDFLVRTCDLEKTCKVLEENGFVKYSNSDEHDFHIIYFKDKVCFELHYRFDEEEGEQSENFTNDIITNAVEIPILDNTAEIKVCNDLYHAITSLLHMKRHMKTAGLGLRHLCDWAVFVNSFESGEFVDLFKDELEKRCLFKYAQALSLVANKFLGLPYKEWFGRFNESGLDCLMYYIYSNGNFGRKEVTMAPLFSQNTDIGTSNGISQLVASVKKIVYSHWPTAENNKLLLCIGFVYFPVKYFIKSLFGKRQKIKVFKSLKTGSEISKVFKELGFYEK